MGSKHEHRPVIEVSPRRLTTGVITFVACLLVSILPDGAVGQVLTTVEFSFSNPGARSLGFGGAFVALADDATAAFANPAGLIQLAQPEISIEGRSWRYTSPYTQGGRAGGAPTGIGIDTVALPLRAESQADLTGLSFLSFVYPTGNWSFAFFHHQLMNFEMTQEIQGLFGPGTVAAGTWRGPIERAFFDFEIATRALAVGYRTGDRLSLGISLSYFDPDIYFTGDDYLPDDDTVESFFAAASFLPERFSHTVIAKVPEGDWGFGAGFLWSLAPQWKIGGVYREGPELELNGELTAGPANADFPTGTQLGLGSSPWDFPDTFGLGVSYRSEDGRWTASFEWDRIEYSTFLESLAPEMRSEGEILSDGDELHLGGEYAFFSGSRVLAIRLGTWLDPDHVIQNNGADAFIRAEHLPGEDELHLAGGFGAVFEKLQIDLGIDLSERRDTASFSVIYSF